MTTNTPPAREHRSFLGQLSYVIAMVAVVITGVIAAVLLMDVVPIAAPRIEPTANVVQPTTRAYPTTPAQTSQDGSGATGDRPAVVVDGIAQNAATAQAMFDAAVRAGESAPNINATGESAPALLVSKPSTREGAGENVPTAEPLTQSNERFGSKQAPVNIQETHTCLHGQVWNGKGCRNP